MFEADFETRRDALEIIRQQILPEVPGCRARRPGDPGALVGAEQHATALLAHVDLTLEVDDVQQLGLSGEFRQIVGDDVLVFHREDGQLEPHHATDLAGPKAAGVDDVLGMHVALLGDHIPAAVGALP